MKKKKTKMTLSHKDLRHWIIVHDTMVRQSWECPDCGHEVFVYPYEYEDIGTPSCPECDCDMVYNHTEYNNG